MSDKPKEERKPQEQDAKQDQKTSDTVHLSAEELRKISGGTTSPNPPSYGGK
jgi:hypothetical protein